MSEQVTEKTEKKEVGPFSVYYPAGVAGGPAIWYGQLGMTLRYAEENAENIVAWLNKVWAEREEKGD